MNITFRVINFIGIFIKLYNCFAACFTVEFTIATDMPITINTRPYFLPTVILVKNQPGDEASVWVACVCVQFCELLHSQELYSDNETA